MGCKSVTKVRSSRTKGLKAEECLSRLRTYLETGDMRTYREFDDQRIEGNLELNPENLGRDESCGLSFRYTQFTGNVILRGLRIIGSGLELSQAHLGGRLTLHNVTFHPRSVPGGSQIQPQVQVDAADLGICQFSCVSGAQRISFSGSIIQHLLCLEDVQATHSVDLRGLQCGAFDTKRLQAEWLLMDGMKITHSGADGRVMIVDPDLGKIACNPDQAQDLFYLTGGRIPLVYRPDW